MPPADALVQKWISLANPTTKALDSTSKSPSLHSSNSALTLISKALSPFALTRGLSQNVFLVIMGILAFFFGILVLMVFRFDLVGGDTGAKKPKEEVQEKLSKIENVRKRKKLMKQNRDEKDKMKKGIDTPVKDKLKNKPIRFKDETNYNLEFKSGKNNKRELMKSIIINFYPFFLMNYEIFFFIASLIGYGSLNCRYVWVKGGLEKAEEGGNFLQENGFDNDLFGGWRQESEEKWVRESVSYLNDTTLCGSNS